MKRFDWLAIGLFAMITTTAAAEALPPATPDSVGLSVERLQRVMDILDADVAAGRIGGAVFGVVRHGKLAWLEAAGYRDKTAGVRMTTDTLFPLASMTKPIASVAAMALVEQGRMVLSDPVAKYLPSFTDVKVAVPGPGGTITLESAKRPPTIQDLLRHTAGLLNAGLYPNTPVGKMYVAAGVYQEPQTLAEEVEKIAHLPLAYQPGSIWDYSQSVDVLARVVEVASGLPFDTFVAKEVTGRIGMKDTAYNLPATEWPRLAEPVVDAAGRLPDRQDARRVNPHFQGNTGLISTATDYLRFGQMMLNGGSLDGGRVLGAGTVAYMTSDHLGSIPHDSASGRYLLGDGRGFGLGFSVRLATGLNVMPGSVGDYDWGGAYGTQFVIDPKQDMVAVLMLNQRNQFDRYFRLFRVMVYQALAN